jgi:hypothetical protein
MAILAPDGGNARDLLVLLAGSRERRFQSFRGPVLAALNASVVRGYCGIWNSIGVNCLGSNRAWDWFC